MSSDHDRSLEDARSVVLEIAPGSGALRGSELPISLAKVTCSRLQHWAFSPLTTTVAREYYFDPGSELSWGGDLRERNGRGIWVGPAVSSRSSLKQRCATFSPGREGTNERTDHRERVAWRGARTFPSVRGAGPGRGQRRNPRRDFGLLRGRGAGGANQSDADGDRAFPHDPERQRRILRSAEPSGGALQTGSQRAFVRELRAIRHHAASGQQRPDQRGAAGRRQSRKRCRYRRPPPWWRRRIPRSPM